MRRLTSGLLAIAGAFLLLQGSHLAWSVAFLLVSVIEWFDLFPAWAARGWLEYKWNPKFKDEYTLTVTPEHLRFKTSTIETTVKWDHYTKVVETDRIFVLVYGKQMYSVIPKRALPGEEEVRTLRNLLNQCIAPGASRQGELPS